MDDSFAPGIGRRLDGWPNRDLNVAPSSASRPNLQRDRRFLLGVDGATVKQVLASWGPGKFDAELNLDGKAFRPDGKAAATLIPPAFGLAGVNLHTWTGWGTVHLLERLRREPRDARTGTFFDPRLNDPAKFPVAAAKRRLRRRRGRAQDLVTPKLGALHFYQLALPSPAPPAGSFDAAEAASGKAVFAGKKAKCATCHVPPLFTEPGWTMHEASEIGIDDFQAKRSPDERYRTAPLKGLWTHMKRGFYHDGRFATLEDVVDHYDQNGVGNGGTPLGSPRRRRRQSSSS